MRSRQLSNYKLQLFQEALVIEQRLDNEKNEKEQKKLARKFAIIADELYYCGWREEYDLWVQNVKE